MVSDVRKTMILLDPTVDAESREIALAKRPAALDGLVVGLLDNGKRNAGKLLELVAEELRRENKIASVVAVRKPNASRPAPDDVLDQLASKVDVAISGIGDWGSCSSCSVHDSIELEKRGIPTAAVCTDQFIPTAKAMAEVGGLPDYPFAIIPHPIGSMPIDQLRKRAELAATLVRDILLKK